MIQKLDQLEKRYHEIQRLVADPAVLRDQGRYRELMRESAGLEEVVEAYSTFKKLCKEIEGTRQVIQEGGDSELVALAREELKELKEKHGPDSLMVASSAKATNEENYAAMKFTRAVLGTNNIDHCARL